MEILFYIVVLSCWGLLFFVCLFVCYVTSFCCKFAYVVVTFDGEIQNLRLSAIALMVLQCISNFVFTVGVSI